MKKIWINHKGQTVPTKYVPKIDKEKERLVLKYTKKAKDLQKRILEFKTDLLNDCDALHLKELQEANVKPSKKGGYSHTSFNKEQKIELSMQEKIEFDDNINLAQEKINEFLELKMKGVDTDLSLLINDAFKTSKGRLDTKRILGLFKLQINHKIWNEAIELIKKSISRNHSKRYVRLFEKNAEGEYKDIQLNISSL